MLTMFLAVNFLLADDKLDVPMLMERFRERFPDIEIEPAPKGTIIPEREFHRELAIEGRGGTHSTYSQMKKAASMVVLNDLDDLLAVHAYLRDEDARLRYVAVNVLVDHRLLNRDESKMRELSRLLAMDANDGGSNKVALLLMEITKEVAASFKNKGLPRADK